MDEENKDLEETPTEETKKEEIEGGEGKEADETTE